MVAHHRDGDASANCVVARWVGGLRVGCDWNDACMVELGNALCSATQLRIVDLARGLHASISQVGTVGVTALTAALGRLSRLESLNLEGMSRSLAFPRGLA